MSDILPESTNRYNRVDSNNLLADTNLVKKGSITTDVVSPSDWNLWSRTGGDLDTARSPIPGYCLHFSQANQLAYQLILENHILKYQLYTIGQQCRKVYSHRPLPVQK